MQENIWLFKNVVVNQPPENYIGFVYVITNLTNGKKYIGQKQMFRTKTLPPLKGKPRKRKSVVESDWRKYSGSCKALNEDIANGDVIKKEILRFCSSKSSLTYFELKEQMKADAMFREDYYNGIINIRLSSTCNNNIMKDSIYYDEDAILKAMAISNS